MGTHLRVLSESYPMNINMPGLRLYLNLCVLVLWMQVTLAMEGLSKYDCSISHCDYVTTMLFQTLQLLKADTNMLSSLCAFYKTNSFYLYCKEDFHKIPKKSRTQGSPTWQTRDVIEPQRSWTEFGRWLHFFRDKYPGKRMT